MLKLQEGFGDTLIRMNELDHTIGKILAASG